LSSLTSADKDFLKGTTINGYLDLSSLTSADKDFLKGTTINGYLDLRSLTSADKDFLNKNIKQLETGYNEQNKYCFFDDILSKVLSVSKRKEYTIYTTPFEFIVQDGKFTSHGKTIKKAIIDLRFKKVSEKLKNDPIKKDTLFTVKYYRLLTGACDSGCRHWMQANNIPFIVKGKGNDEETLLADKNRKESKGMKAIDLLPLLEKSNAYGLDKFKKLITF
jgi:hypothetical protein